MRASTPTTIYATWNPADKNSNLTLSNGNLTASTTGGGSYGVRSTISKTTGKWYWEIYITSIANANASIGIGNSSMSLSQYIGSDNNGLGWYNSGGIYKNSSLLDTYTSYVGSGSILGIALDADAGTLKLYHNNTLQGTIATIPTSPHFAVMNTGDSSDQITANFGATAFTYTPPSGYNAGLYT